MAGAGDTPRGLPAPACPGPALSPGRSSLRRKRLRTDAAVHGHRPLRVAAEVRGKAALAPDGGTGARTRVRGTDRAAPAVVRIAYIIKDMEKDMGIT